MQLFGEPEKSEPQLELVLINVNDPSKPISILPLQFPGEEDIEYWAVVYADGVGPEDGFKEFLAVNKDPSLGEIWIAGENLILADAELCAAETSLAHPDRRIFVMQMRPSLKEQQ
jgi:hypothetical protein